MKIERKCIIPAHLSKNLEKKKKKKDEFLIYSISSVHPQNFADLQQQQQKMLILNYKYLTIRI